MPLKKTTPTSYAIAELKRLRNEVNILIDHLEENEPRRKKADINKMYMICPKTGKKKYLYKAQNKT